MQEHRIEAQPNRIARFDLTLLLVSGALLLTGYTITLLIANRLSLSVALLVGAANSLPVLLFGYPAYRLARDQLVRMKWPLQLVGHLALGTVFALLAYWLLMVLLGLIHGASVTEFAVRPFPSRNMAWQLLENATIYGLVALLAALHGRAAPIALMLGNMIPADRRTEGRLGRYFVRRKDEIHPLDVQTIISIVGADDYSEIVTSYERHLVRMTLAAFEKSLDPDQFVRIHRSRIVNLKRVERVEPAGGGRLLLHLENGEIVAASRAGSRLLRDRAI